MWEDFNTAVQAIDVAALDRAGLGDLAGEIGRTRAVLDSLEARVAVGLRRLGASEASAAEMLRQRTGCSTREAKHRTRRAEVLRKMPNVAGALSAGRLTGEHASALARAAAETSPEEVDRDAGLLAETSSVPADAASGKARDWVRRHQTDDDLERLHHWQRRNRSLLFAAGEGGMIAGIAKFDQVSGAQFQNLVQALADRLYRADGGRDNPHARTRAQCRHDALLMLVGIEPAPAPALAASAGSNSSDASNTVPAASPNGSDAACVSAGGGSAGPDGSSAAIEAAGDGGAGLGGLGAVSEAAGDGRASTGRAGPGLFLPRPEPLPESTSVGPAPSSRCAANSSGSGPEAAGNGWASSGGSGAGSTGSGSGPEASGNGGSSSGGSGAGFTGSGSGPEASGNGWASSGGSGAGSTGSGSGPEASGDGGSSSGGSGAGFTGSGSGPEASGDGGSSSGGSGAGFTGSGSGPEASGDGGSSSGGFWCRLHGLGR